ncbi:class I SAM-dependent methyltransferase [Actinocrispum wychmicini]|uniref:Methyltransferase family protein n=1 Tax=Actinocrispum wychmicini TaxID=1213861 RepID=A0A4R2JYB4_9PSEU|nr:methyltransferase domain-containing protein [Actinocrispum wychmicini]TCO62239.1 methyltransferase family protein [Actinocrispum wychmicini]
MSKTRLAVRALRLAITRSTSDPIHDYNAASPTYDSFFTKVMGVHSVAALDQVTIRPGNTVVELACGTGHLTEAIGERLAGRGVIRAVDKSPGMLEVARAKVTGSSLLDVTLEAGDMEEFLRRQPTASADVVVCGWAICYGKPPQLLRQIHRVLKPEGHVLIIETRADALQNLVRPLERVFADDPSLLTSLIRISLPKSAAVVARWFEKAGLVVTHQSEGSQVLPVTTPDAALEWVQRSGAAAGFKDAVDSQREEEVLRKLRDELAVQVASSGQLQLRHTFLVVTGRKPAA